MRIRPLRSAWAIAAVAALAGTARAEVKPHPLFSDGAVLQRDREVPVWGTADDGETVTVKIQEQEASAKAQDGRWLVRLKPMKAGGPFTMTIEGKNKVELKDVLVGEVWVCSGQSNMEWSLEKSYDAEKTMAASDDPKLRLFMVPHKTAAEPLRDPEAKGFPIRRGQQVWKAAGPNSVAKFSAVAYFFGRDLRKALGVPVGLIESSVGGTPAEAWTSRKALDADSSFANIFEADARKIANYPEALERHKKATEAHKKAVEEAKEAGKKPPQAPRAPSAPDRDTHRPAVLYNGMIAPLEPYAIRGAIWYQGESNAGQAYQYQQLFSAMIGSWRDAWGQGDFPFLFVQLAPFMKIQDQPGESAWAELRESQRLTARNVPHTAMAVITDVGEENDIHPKHKAEVGERLAKAALADVYGQKIVGSGPDLDRVEIKGDRAIVHFRHVGGGLVVKDEPLRGFTIAGADHVFHNADAHIEGDAAVVHSDKVKDPVAVRFGWANYPVVNLWNEDGLPATPFRTDDFPLSTLPKPRSEKASR